MSGTGVQPVPDTAECGKTSGKHRRMSGTRSHNGRFCMSGTGSSLDISCRLRRLAASPVRGVVLAFSRLPPDRTLGRWQGGSDPVSAPPATDGRREGARGSFGSRSIRGPRGHGSAFPVDGAYPGAGRGDYAFRSRSRVRRWNCPTGPDGPGGPPTWWHPRPSPSRPGPASSPPGWHRPARPDSPCRGRRRSG